MRYSPITTWVSLPRNARIPWVENREKPNLRTESRSTSWREETHASASWCSRQFRSCATTPPPISRGTVYRNLHLLADTGEILSVKTPGGERFDRRMDHHAHLVCSECGTVIDVPMPKQDDFCRQIERSTGYASVSTSTILTGVCPACQERTRREKSAPAAADAR